MNFSRHTTMLLCSDVARARDFYLQHFDLEVTADIDWFVGLKHKEQPIEAFEMSLCDASHISLPASLRRPSRGVVLAFQVPGVDNECNKLRAAGVSILAEPVDEPWGQRHFFAAAPDGVALDIFEPIAANPQWLKNHGFV